MSKVPLLFFILVAVFAVISFGLVFHTIMSSSDSTIVLAGFVLLVSQGTLGALAINSFLINKKD